MVRIIKKKKIFSQIKQIIGKVFACVPDSSSVTGTSPLRFRSNTAVEALENYRIYGQTSPNILPLSTTPKTEQIGDILCEYDGKGGFIFTSAVDNPSYPDIFVVDLMEEITPPKSIRRGGTGCIQLNNTGHSTSTGPAMMFALYNEDDMDVLTEIDVTGDYIVSDGYDLYDDGPETATGVAFMLMNKMAKGTIKFQIALYENVANQIPYIPYGDGTGDPVESGAHAGEYLITIEINDHKENIYLAEQIRSEEYIDFATQKQYFSDGTSTDITLPIAPIHAGENRISVDAKLQSSAITVTGRGIKNY